MFFPIFCLVAAYPAGYYVFAVVLTCEGALFGFLARPGTVVWKKFKNGLKIGVVPILASTLASLVIMPGFAYELVVRLGLMYQQTTGWPLPFFSPLFFSGLPYFNSGAFIVDYNAVFAKGDVFQFVPLLLVVIFLLIVINLKKYYFLINDKYEDDKKSQNEQKSLIITICLAYIVGIATYLVLYLINGHVYKVWKFATYTALPLSFVPTALAVYGATVLSRILKVASLKKICLGIVLAVYLVLWVRMPGVQDIPIKYYNVVSAIPFIYNLSNIKSMMRPNSTVYLDFSEYSKMAIAPLVLKNDKNIKFKFINATSYFTSDPFYSKSVDEDTVIISDTDYQGIFRGEKLPPFNYNLYYYHFDRLKTCGMAVIYTGQIPYYWKTDGDGGWTLVDVKIPLELVGRTLRLRLSLSLTPGADGEVSDCRKVRVDLLENGSVSDSYDLRDDNVVLRLPSSLTASGVVKFKAYPVDVGCSGNPGPRVYDVLGVYLD
jgi:hypothetical protein